MAVLKRKSRMISLRLSSEEYESLRSLYRMHGSRSVSEFARNAMQKVIGEAHTGPATIDSRLQELDSKMSSLDREVGRLVELIQLRLSEVKSSTADA